MNGIYYYVDNNYKLKTCIKDGDGWVRFYDEDEKLMNYRQSYNKKNIFENVFDAAKRATFLKNLYQETFKHVPYLKEEILVEHKDQLLHIENEITKQLNEYPNFEGIDFCDVSAGGIQIRGHHKQIKGYTYGKQLTIAMILAITRSVLMSL
jgi:hypothetical protein